MSNNKQSSVVDFIYNELFVVKRWMDLTPGDIEYIFKQAKAKQREDMIGLLEWMNEIAKTDPMRLETDKDDIVDMYYNETFGGNNEQQ